MAVIIPFRGLRYSQEKIKRLDKVVTPPYDVISRPQQSELYKADRYNFIRIILGKEKKGDNHLHNKYSRARDYLLKWMKQGVLVSDDQPSLYVYEQIFNLDGKKLRRLGFIALLKLEPPGKGVVYPHEKTFCKPKEDRFNLLKAVRANLSPLFGLYRDDTLKIDALLLTACGGNKPIIDIQCEGIAHRVWRVSDGALIRQLESFMADKKIFIADGHHRYEVAYCYKKLMKRSQALHADYVMMYFCNLKSDGLKILPYHRVLRRIPAQSRNTLTKLLSPYFSIRSFSSQKELFRKLGEIENNQQGFGLYSGKRRFYLLTLKPKKITCVSKSGIRCYNRLDAVLLHNLILHKLLGMKEKNKDNPDIFYTRDALEAAQLVNSKKYQAAFFMNPPQPSQVSAMAVGLKMMPHKSTYFYPKPLSGLVINLLGS